jgi:ABC-type amino acid transport substrate-binding protein
MKKVLALILAVLLMVAMCGCSKAEYGDLHIMEGVHLSELEGYGIAFRKGSDAVEHVEKAIDKLYDDGTAKLFASSYGVVDNLLVDFLPSDSYSTSGDSDWAYIQKKGTLVIGVTSFKPMDYLNSISKWIGFDADLAREVCKELGVTAQFKEIVWATKEQALDSKAIDCIWNGMTLTAAIRNTSSVTAPYMTNRQVVVVKDEKYGDLASLKGKTVAVEAGSAGAAAAAKIDGVKIKEVESMADAMLQVQSGAADACVVDSVMANSMINAH